MMKKWTQSYLRFCKNEGSKKSNNIKKKGSRSKIKAKSGTKPIFTVVIKIELSIKRDSKGSKNAKKGVIPREVPYDFQV